MREPNAVVPSGALPVRPPHSPLLLRENVGRNKVHFRGNTRHVGGILGRRQGAFRYLFKTTFHQRFEQVDLMIILSLRSGK